MTAAHLQKTITHSVGKTMHRQGLTLIPGRLHHWTGANVENLADGIQLSQPAKHHDKGQFSITAVVEQQEATQLMGCAHALH